MNICIGTWYLLSIKFPSSIPYTNIHLTLFFLIFELLSRKLRKFFLRVDQEAAKVSVAAQPRFELIKVQFDFNPYKSQASSKFRQRGEGGTEHTFASAICHTRKKLLQRSDENDSETRKWNFLVVNQIDELFVAETFPLHR